MTDTSAQILKQEVQNLQYLARSSPLVPSSTDPEWTLTEHGLSAPLSHFVRLKRNWVIIQSISIIMFCQYLCCYNASDERVNEKSGGNNFMMKQFIPDSAVGPNCSVLNKWINKIQFIIIRCYFILLFTKNKVYNRSFLFCCSSFYFKMSFFREISLKDLLHSDHK